MGWLDRVPRAGNLYIGSQWALRRTEDFHALNITHVLSVVGMLDNGLISSRFKHMIIDVNDDEDENLLHHFPATNRFIEGGLASGGGVYVHCAMGKSRSATCVIAYLMNKNGITPEEALDQVREGRGVCEPNSGFWKQLQIYYRMKAPDEVENKSMYQRWVYECALATSRSCQQAPEIDNIRFEDEVESEDESAVDTSFKLKCRKCRNTLATSQYIVEHKPKRPASVDGQPVTSSPLPPCAHYFVDALSWMRSELEQGKLEGRLECPNCKTNVGKYAWQGSQCSCAAWIVPGISLNKSRIDEIKSNANGDSTNADIRLPPGFKPGRGPSQGNL